MSSKGEDILNNLFNAYRHTSDYKDRSMVEIMTRRGEFEEHLNKMWNIYLSGNTQQIIEYNKQIDDIKHAGLKVLRNSVGKHKIVHK